MILSLDSSALVKCYLVEVGSQIVSALGDASEFVATAGISHVEVIAALAKVSRLGNITSEDATTARHLFEAEWPDFLHSGGAALEHPDREQILVPHLPNVGGAQGHERLGSAGSLDELDFEMLRRVDLDHRSKVTLAQSLLWEISI